MCLVVCRSLVLWWITRRTVSLKLSSVLLVLFDIVMSRSFVNGECSESPVILNGGRVLKELIFTRGNFVLIL